MVFSYNTFFHHVLIAEFIYAFADSRTSLTY